MEIKNYSIPEPQYVAPWIAESVKRLTALGIIDEVMKLDKSDMIWFMKASLEVCE